MSTFGNDLFVDSFDKEKKNNQTTICQSVIKSLRLMNTFFPFSLEHYIPFFPDLRILDK